MCIFLLVGCCSAVSSHEDHKNILGGGDNSILDENKTQTAHTQAEDQIDTSDPLLKDCDYYNILQSDSLYYCYFYDRNHNVVKTEGPLTKSPHVEFVDESLVRFTLQAGTGIGTQWGYFYDIEEGAFSDTFQSIYDQADGKVVYTEGKYVIVRNIFDEDAYCKVFSDFSQPFSEVVEPFVEIRFAEDGSYIEITYLSGPDYSEITEIFQL